MENFWYIACQSKDLKKILSRVATDNKLKFTAHVVIDKILNYIQSDIRKLLHVLKDLYYMSNGKVINENILDAYLKDSSIEIKNVTNSAILDTGIWLNTYNEYKEYVLIKQKEEYPIFKVNEDGEVFKLDYNFHGVYVLSLDVNRLNKRHSPDKSVFNSWKTIPYDKERGLYHKQPVWVITDGTCEIAFAFISDKYEIESDITYICYPNSNSEYFTAENNHVKPITMEQLKTMPFVWEMYKQLED